MFIDGGEIIGMMAVFGIIIVPSIGLTARFALKPIVESIVKMREALDRPKVAQDDPRIPMLQQDFLELRETVDRLATAVEFDTQLRLSAGNPPTLPKA